MDRKIQARLDPVESRAPIKKAPKLYSFFPFFSTNPDTFPPRPLKNLITRQKMCQCQPQSPLLESRGNETCPITEGDRDRVRLQVAGM